VPEESRQYNMLHICRNYKTVETMWHLTDCLILQKKNVGVV